MTCYVNQLTGTQNRAHSQVSRSHGYLDASKCYFNYNASVTDNIVSCDQSSTWQESTSKQHNTSFHAC